jgi:hypothetical protein
VSRLLFPSFKLFTVLSTSNHFDRIISQFSQAMTAAIGGNHPGCSLLQDFLIDLRDLRNRTVHLTKMAYEWCSVVYENLPNLADGGRLLLLSLEIGFRHLDPNDHNRAIQLVHTGNHWQMTDIVFGSGHTEAIADLLQAWILGSEPERPLPSLRTCVENLAGRHNLQPFSPRFRQLVIHSVELVGCEGPWQAEVEGFIGLLDQLCVGVEDMQDTSIWVGLLLGILRSSEGTQRLSHRLWELLVELVVLGSQLTRYRAYIPQTTTYLKNAQKWDELECWVVIVWILWPPESQNTAEVNLVLAMSSLAHERPDALRKLEQLMEKWSRATNQNIPGLFPQFCQDVR